MQRSQPPSSFRRSVSIERGAVQDSGAVEVSFSSETDGVRFGNIPQVLLHERGAVDLTGLNSVLHNHDPMKVLGRAVGARVDTSTRKGRASIIFDSDPESQAVAGKVRSGSIVGASVGFKVNAWQALDSGEEWTSPEGRRFTGPADIATSWRAYEFSITPIPADSTVGIGRSINQNSPRGNSMDPEISTDYFSISPNSETAAAPATETRAERSRQREIRSMCARFEPAADLADGLCDSGATVEQARAAILEKLGTAWPCHDSVRRVESVAGGDEVDKFRTAAANGLRVRAGAKIDPKEPTHFTSSLFELARESLRRAHDRTVLTDRAGLISRAISHSASDFPAILSNAANKSLVQAYVEAPASFRPLVKVVAATDFKTMARPRFGQSGELIETAELEPMTETSFAEASESYAISTFSRRFGLSRRAIIDDDLSAFERVPSEMGRSARRTVNRKFYELLTSNAGTGPAMVEGSQNLFSASHASGSNYLAAVGALDVTNLGVAKKLMRLQRGLVAAGETASILNIEPAFLLVPAALEGAALQVVAAITPNSVSSARPSWIQALTVIAEGLLDGTTNGTTNWLLFANPNSFPCCEVAYLDGNENPTLDRIEGTNILGVEWSVVLDFGIHFIDHRGAFRQRGA